MVKVDEKPPKSRVLEGGIDPLVLTGLISFINFHFVNFSS